MSEIKTAPFKTVDIFDDISGIKHGFFTCQGGVSEGIYNSLNTGKGSQDDPSHVLQNIDIICQTMGVNTCQLQTLHQTHSNTTHIINTITPLINGDGLVTDKLGIALGIKSADCVPILFACAQTKIIGACHAGWEGAFKSIAQSTIQSMIDIGANPSTVHAAIGPCLHQNNFEVGLEFVDRFTKQSSDNKDFFIIPDGKEKYHFDLISYLKKQLTSCGVLKIKTSDFDTYNNDELFFSYRRSCHKNEPDYGRQLSVILRTE